MFDKKQKSCVKCIHLVTDDGLYDRKAFYKVKIDFYSLSMNDGEFINYTELVSLIIHFPISAKLHLAENMFFLKSSPLSKQKITGRSSQG